MGTVHYSSRTNQLVMQPHWEPNIDYLQGLHSWTTVTPVGPAFAIPQLAPICTIYWSLPEEIKIQPYWSKGWVTILKTIVHLCFKNCHYPSDDAVANKYDVKSSAARAGHPLRGSHAGQLQAEQIPRLVVDFSHHWKERDIDICLREARLRHQTVLD